MEKGFITAEQVINALRIQVMEDIEKGKHRLIGRILLEQGLITLSQINDLLSALGKNLPLFPTVSTSDFLCFLHFVLI